MSNTWKAPKARQTLKTNSSKGSVKKNKKNKTFGWTWFAWEWGSAKIHQ